MKSTHNLFVGLDIATKMGVAFVNFGSKKITTVVYKGTPQIQLERLVDVVGDFEGVVVRIETLVSFRNAKTTRSLLTRTGYISHSLENEKATIEYVTPTEARRFLGVKTKAEVKDFFNRFAPGITDDEADAIAVAVYKNVEDLNFDDWKFERILYTV
jgi:Holliday junction resolvasome RuvABC endonuclease subunit